MLKYEHLSGDYEDYAMHEYVSRVREAGGACRVTTNYKGFSPDIKYYYNNEYHRTDGPAFIDLADGEVSFWVGGNICILTKKFCERVGMSDEETFMWVLRFGDRLPMTCEWFYGEDWRSIPMDQL